MTDLQMFLQAIDELPPNELEQIKQHVEQRQSLAERRVDEEDIETWIANLHAAIDAFREGLSDDELRNIVNDMNIGYISPKELQVLDQIAAWGEEDEI